MAGGSGRPASAEHAASTWLRRWRSRAAATSASAPSAPRARSSAAARAGRGRSRRAIRRVVRRRRAARRRSAAPARSAVTMPRASTWSEQLQRVCSGCATCSREHFDRSITSSAGSAWKRRKASDSGGSRPDRGCQSWCRTRHEVARGSCAAAPGCSSSCPRRGSARRRTARVRQWGRGAGFSTLAHYACSRTGCRSTPPGGRRDAAHRAGLAADGILVVAPPCSENMQGTDTSVLVPQPRHVREVDDGAAGELRRGVVGGRLPRPTVQAPVGGAAVRRPRSRNRVGFFSPPPSSSQAGIAPTGRRG